LKDKIKKKFNYTEGLKKIKRMTIKIEIQNKFYIWLKVENEMKNQFRIKELEKKTTIKIIRIKIDKNNKNIFLIKGWNWKEN